ncbi:unnamed protein product [Anisakis simplex]|uniref:Arrestin_N domain-containing protein n=1 Tax=Anisakis simplex TaxID=6269 RepID=A0A0M3J4U2_ANISI|nr:unnamed protein product [Anisakis simplex]
MFAVNEPSRAYSIEVTLGERIYNPGDLIQGRIHLSLNRKLFCDTILVQLYGAVKVFWTATTQDDQGTFQRIPFAQKEVLVNQKSVVWSAENKPKTLPKTLSVSAFEISFLCNPDIPPSCSTQFSLF